MLIHHREDIRYSVNRLRDMLTLTINRISEDPRNEPICEKFRHIRDKEAMSACKNAQRGTEEDLERAVDQAQTAMIHMLELHANYTQGKSLAREQLPDDQRLKMHGIYTAADRRDEESGKTKPPNTAGKNAGGPEVDVEIEGFLIVAELPHLFNDIRAELKASGANMEVFDRVYSDFYKSNPPYDEPNYVMQLQYVMSNTCSRLFPIPENDCHHNMPVGNELLDLVTRLENAAGNGFAQMILAIVDPIEALTAPPPPTHQEVMKTYDGIFRDLHKLLHSKRMEEVVPLRNTMQCRLSLQGSIRMIKEALPRAVRDLESKGESFPRYHEVADRGRGR